VRVIQPTTKETSVPTIIGPTEPVSPASTAVCPFSIFTRTGPNSTTVAPPIAGIASRNENLAADSRVKSRHSPPAIVLPERETPRRRAAVWNKPTSRASTSVISFRSRRFCPSLCPNHRRAAVMSQPQATTVGLLKDPWIFFLKRMPITETGMVAITTQAHRR